MTSVHCCTLEQNGSSLFFPSFDNANGRLCQERLLRSTNVATMVTWRHTSLHWTTRQQTIIHLPPNRIQWTCAYCKLFTNGRNQFKFDYHFFTMLLDISPYCSKDCTQQASTENYITQILTTADAMLNINSFQNPKSNTIQYWFLQK